MFKALQSMKSLKKLWIWECTFKAAEIPDTIQPLNLTHFGIHFMDSIPEVLLSAVSCPGLRVLEANLQEHSPDSSLYFIRKPIKWHLEELSVTSAMIEYREFATFLNKTPSIRTLSIGRDLRNPPFVSVLSLRPSSLPTLECLKCYPMVLPQILPGRAVKHIHVFNQRFSWKNPPLEPVELAALKESAAHLETLQIPLSYIGKLIDGEHFPYLRTLIIEYDLVPSSIPDVSWLLHLFSSTCIDALP
jgi:hypothetical protein